jgi:hypothetical protein
MLYHPWLLPQFDTEVTQAGVCFPFLLNQKKKMTKMSYSPYENGQPGQKQHHPMVYQNAQFSLLPASSYPQPGLL